MAKKEAMLRETAERNKKEEREEMAKKSNVTGDCGKEQKRGNGDCRKNRQAEVAYTQTMLERDAKIKEEAEAKDRTMQLALADKELLQMQERQAILEGVKIMQKAFEEKSERDAT